MTPERPTAVRFAELRRRQEEHRSDEDREKRSREEKRSLGRRRAVIRRCGRRPEMDEQVTETPCQADSRGESCQEREKVTGEQKRNRRQDRGESEQFC